MNVRASPSGAHSYFSQCHMLSKSRMRVKENGMGLSFGTAATA
ncbi:hypothetical protein [Myxococcus sp. CA040A]|nr:hypothetical protein [Myxococcus sp. CA040A]